MEQPKNGPCTCAPLVPGVPPATHESGCPSFSSPLPAPDQQQQPAPKRLNARQFFDVWTEAVCTVGRIRETPVASRLTLETFSDKISERHGPQVAELGRLYVETLRADSRSGGGK